MYKQRCDRTDAIVEIMSSFSFSIIISPLELLIHKTGHHLLQNTEITTSSTSKVALNALLNILAHDINLNINLLPSLLRRRDNLLLRIRNKHHLPVPILPIHHLGHSQTRPIQRDIALLDDIPQHALVARLQTEDQGVAVRRDGEDGGDGVDVALDEVAAHARVGFHGALEIHLGVFLEGSEIRTAEGFRGDADFEVGFVEGSNCEACSFFIVNSLFLFPFLALCGISLTIDTDAVAQMSVCEDLLAMRDGQRCATPAAQRGVEGLEGGHSCRKHNIS